MILMRRLEPRDWRNNDEDMSMRASSEQSEGYHCAILYLSQSSHVRSTVCPLVAIYLERVLHSNFPFPPESS